MVMDNIGLAAAVALTHACASSERLRWWLPFAAFPILATGDLYSIYRWAEGLMRIFFFWGSWGC